MLQFTILFETCKGIWDVINNTYLKFPSSKSAWQNINKKMFDEWNFLNCVCSLDRKHVRVDCPKNCGWEYFDYKGYYNIVLFAMCDKNVYIRQFRTIFYNDLLGKGLTKNAFNMPESNTINGFRKPFVILGDDVFALKTYLMKSFSRRNISEEELVFNDRQSKGKRTIIKLIWYPCRKIENFMLTQ